MELLVVLMQLEESFRSPAKMQLNIVVITFIVSYSRIVHWKRESFRFGTFTHVKPQ